MSDVISKSEVVDQKQWTILSLLEWGAEYLAERGLESSRLTVELLLTRVLDCSRLDLYTRFDAPLSSEELLKFKSMFKRKLAREPLQYILGEEIFMGLALSVDQRVLIPRPETEVLVENVVNHIKSENRPYNNILDIGTGSCNIAIALAHFLSNIHIDAVDVSEHALRVAKANRARYAFENRIDLIQCDVLQNSNRLESASYDLIVSNPPYISRDEYETLEPEVKNYEPPIAATDGGDGLTFFRAIAKSGTCLLKPGGEVFVEIAYNQSESVPKIFHDADYDDIECFKDYSGIVRVVKAKRRS